MLTRPGEVTWPADYITISIHLARTQKNLQTDLFTKSLHISKFTARCARSNDLLHSALNEATKCECDDAMRRDRHRGIPASITRLPSGKKRATASALKTYKTHILNTYRNTYIYIYIYIIYDSYMTHMTYCSLGTACEKLRDKIRQSSNVRF